MRPALKVSASDWNKHSINGATTNFLYDGINPVQELSGGSVTANLLTGPGVDEYLTRADASGTSNFLSYALGSTLALADPTGTVQTQYTYDPFGATTTQGGANASSYQFTGRENDGTGLYFYRARYYEPALGRFLSEDPVRLLGGIAFYPYGANSPTNFRDPSGQFPTWWHFDETYKLAKDVFGPGCAGKAKEVADADATVDYPWWSVQNPFGSAWQYGAPHFPVGNYADLLVGNAISTCSLKGLGRALHTLQDGFAHPPGPLGPLLHLVTGPLVDWPNGVNGAAAAGATRAALQEFKDKCLSCCPGSSTGQLVAR